MLDIIVQVNYSIKEIISVERWMFARVVILNCSRVNCIIERLCLSCHWFLDIFSLYSLSETWPFIFDYRTRTSIASRYWHDYSSQYFIKWVAFTGHDQFWTRRDTEYQIIRVNCIVKEIEFVVLLIFRYVLVIWLDLNLLHDLFASWLYFLSMSMSCSWCKGFRCLFLAKFSFLF